MHAKMNRHNSRPHIPAFEKGTISKAYKCSTCNRMYCAQIYSNNITGRIPLLMPCSHTICEECVRSMAKFKNISCKVCLCEIQLESPEEYANFCPVDRFMLGSLMDMNSEVRGKYPVAENQLKDVPFLPAGMSISSRYNIHKRKGAPARDIFPINQDTKSCSQIRCSKRAEFRCIICRDLYCTKCDKKVHESIRILRNHVRYPIDIADLTEFNAPCFGHPDSIADQACFTCGNMFCSKCILKNHGGHDYISIEDKNAKELESFKEVLMKGEAVLKSMEYTNKKVKQEINSIRPNTKPNHLEPKIVAYFASLHSHLQLLEQSILKQLNKAQNSKLESLHRLSTELNNNIEIMHSLVDTGKLVVGGGQDYLDKFILSELEKTITDNLILPCELIEEDNISKKEDPIQFITDESFLDTLQNHCHIEFEEGCSFKLAPMTDFSARIYDFPSDEDTINSSDTDSIRSRNESESSGSQISYIKKGCKTRLSLAGSTPTLYGRPKEPKETPKSPNEPTVFIKNTIETVTVTHLTDPSLFYVQLSRKRKLIEDLTNKYQLYAEHAVTPVKPEIGSTYLVQYTNDKFKQWYRAIVKEILSIGLQPSYEVFYIDYGNTGVVRENKIKIIKPLFMKDPPFAYRCRLNGIISQRNNWSDDVLQYMLRFISVDVKLPLDPEQRKNFIIYGNRNQTLKMHILQNEKGVLDVDLYAHNESLSMALIFVGYAQPMSHVFDQDKLQKYVEDETKIVTAIDTYQKDKVYSILVSHVVNPHSIYVQLFENRKSIENLEIAMTRMYEKKDHRKMIFTPRIGMICAAKLKCSNKNWWRVEIVDLPGNASVKVYALDYGNTEIVSWNSLCKLKDIHKQTDAQAIQVSLSDIAPPSSTENEWPEKASEFLRSYLKGKTLSMYVNQPSKEKLMVTLYEHTDGADICIDALLVRKNLAETTGESSLLVEFHKILPGDGEPKDPTNTKPGQTIKELKPLSFAELNKNIIMGKHFTVDVKVLKLNSPNSFYVELTHWDKERLRMHKMMEHFYSEQVFCGKKWELNSLCVVRSAKDDKYYRGIITKVVEDNLYEVFLKDIFKYEEVFMDNIFELDPAFATHDYVFHCKLGGIRSTGGTDKWPARATEIFQEFLDNYDNIAISKYGPIDNQVLSVQLFTKWEETVGPLDPIKIHTLVLNEYLISCGVAIPLKTISNESIIKGTESPTNTLNAVPKTQKKFPDDFESELAPFYKFVDPEPQPIEDVEPVSSVPTCWLPPVKCTDKRFKANPTFVDFEGAIYIQTFKAQRMLRNITRILNTHFKDTKPDPPHDWEVGQMCTVLYHVDKSFCRGTVIEVQGEKIVVQLIDFGNQEECDHDELRSEVLAFDIPALCYKCKLAGVVPKTEDNKWSIHLLDRLHYTLVDKPCEVVVDESEDIDDVPHIFIYLNNECINNLCNTAEWSADLPKHIPKPDSDDEKDVIVEDIISDEDTIIEIIDSSHEEIVKDDEYLTVSESGYSHVKLPVSEQTFRGFVMSIIDYRTVVVEPEFAFDIMSSTRDRFDAMSEEIAELGFEQPVILTPVIGMACIAIFGDDAKWYRAEIMDVMGFHCNEIKVLFIDYGNVEIVPKEDVRLIKQEWLELPVTMLRCKIWGILTHPKYDDIEAMAAMKEVAVNSDVKVVCQIMERSPELEIKIINEETYELVYKSLIDQNVIQSIEKY